MSVDLDTEKTVIRSLLVANKTNMLLEQFLQDYRESEGRNLPFKDFEFKSAREFLESLTDTVRVTVQGSMVSLSPAITKDIQHIDKLVRTQKPAPSKRGKSKYCVARSARRVTQPLVTRRPKSIVDTFRARASQGKFPSSLCAPEKHGAFSVSESNSNVKSSESNAISLAGGDQASGESMEDKSLHTAQTLTSGIKQKSAPVLNSWDAQVEAVLQDSGAVSQVYVHKEPVLRSPTPSAGNQSMLNSTGAQRSECSDPNTAVHTTYCSGTVPFATKPLRSSWAEKICQPAESARELVPLGLRQQGVGVQFTNPLQLPRGRNPSYNFSQGVNQGVLYQAFQSIQYEPSPRVLVNSVPYFQSPQMQFGAVGPLPVPSPVVFNSPRTVFPVNPPLNVAAPPYVPRFYSGMSTPESYIDTQTICKQESKQQESKERQEVDREDMPEDVIEGITSILKQRPDGINVELLSKLYKEELGAHSYFSNRNRSSEKLVIELIDHIERVSVSSVWGKYVVKLIEPFEEDKPSSPNLPDEIAQGVEKILQEHPEGVLVQELANMYEAKYGPHTYFSNEGCSPARLTLAVVNSNPSVTAVSLSNRKCLLKLKLEEVSTSSSSSSEELSTYCRQTLPTTQEFPVSLGEVYNPSAFHILVKGKNTSEALDQLMSEMNAFYNKTSSEAYRLNRADIRSNTPCAAPYMVNGRLLWHRALILSRVFLRVNVWYVDYGTCEQVSEDQLRHMLPEFLELPTQGCKVRLAGIKPRGSESWSGDAKLHFLRLMKGADLWCKVEEWDGEDIGVKLWKVGDKESSIADLLVSDGYAEEVRPDRPAPVRDWTIKPHYLQGGSQLDVVTWNGTCYVTGRNVSELFSWEPSAIEDLLLEKQISFNVTVVSHSYNPALFVDVAHTQCQDTWNGAITLYKLQNLPDLLNLFCHPSRALREEVENIIGEEVYLSDASTDEDECEEHQQKLENKLMMLYEERKELRMSVYTGNLSRKDELSFVERKIGCTEELLAQVKARLQLKCRRAPNGAVPSCSSESDTAVQGLQTKLMELLARK